MIGATKQTTNYFVIVVTRRSLGGPSRGPPLYELICSVKNGSMLVFLCILQQYELSAEFGMAWSTFNEHVISGAKVVTVLSFCFWQRLLYLWMKHSHGISEFNTKWKNCMLCMGIQEHTRFYKWYSTPFCYFVFPVSVRFAFDYCYLSW